jgi:hypothetical protein
MKLGGTAREHARGATDDYHSSKVYAKQAIRASRTDCAAAFEAFESAQFAMGLGRAEHRYAPGQADVMAANRSCSR